jgi:hypothetical protein
MSSTSDGLAKRGLSNATRLKTAEPYLVRILVGADISLGVETNTPRSVAVIVDAVYKAARLMMPEQDWAWLKAIKARLYSHAPPSGPTGPRHHQRPALGHW